MAIALCAGGGFLIAFSSIYTQTEPLARVGLVIGIIMLILGFEK